MATGGRAGGVQPQAAGGRASDRATPPRRALGSPHAGASLLGGDRPRLALVVGAVVMIAVQPARDRAASTRFLPITPTGALLQGSVLVRTRSSTRLSTPRRWSWPAWQSASASRPACSTSARQGQFLHGRAGGRRRSARRWTAPAPVVAIPVVADRRRCSRRRRLGFIPGSLKAFTGAHEVVTTIMLNFVAHLIWCRTSSPGRCAAPAGRRLRPDRRRSLARRAADHRSAGNGHLGILFAAPGRPAHLVAALPQHASASRSAPSAPTPTPHATRACTRAGIIVLTMSICGLLAGLAGAGEILGVSRLHAGRLLAPTSASTPSRWRCWAARTRSASCSPPSCSARCAPAPA